MKEPKSDAKMATFQVLKNEVPSGVTVDLLPDNAILIRGLRPEWPPWIKLEPNLERISISSDGKNWQEQNVENELWILSDLDPRHVLRHARLEESLSLGKTTLT